MDFAVLPCGLAMTETDSRLNLPVCWFASQSWKLICADGTHNVTDKAIKLVTVCVVDDGGYTNPVAWCFAAEESIAHLYAFFQIIAWNVSEDCARRVTCLMSDDAPACTVLRRLPGWPRSHVPLRCVLLVDIAAARRVFPVVNHLLCCWHVARR
jgi:hypothetical protein